MKNLNAKTIVNNINKILEKKRIPINEAITHVSKPVFDVLSKLPNENIKFNYHFEPIIWCDNNSDYFDPYLVKFFQLQGNEDIIYISNIHLINDIEEYNLESIFIEDNIIADNDSGTPENNIVEYDLQELSDAINSYFYCFHKGESVLLHTKYKSIEKCNNYNVHSIQIVFDSNIISGSSIWIGNRKYNNLGKFYTIDKFIKEYSNYTPETHTIDYNEFINKIDDLDELTKLKAIIATRENIITIQKQVNDFNNKEDVYFDKEHSIYKSVDKNNNMDGLGIVVDDQVLVIHKDFLNFIFRILKASDII